MKNRSLFLSLSSFCLISILAAMLFITACASSTPAPVTTSTAPSISKAPSSAPSETVAPKTAAPGTTAPVVPKTASSATIRLRLAHFLPPVAAEGRLFDEWAKKLKEQTNGNVEITIFPNETLCAANDTYESLVGGLCDIGFCPALQEPDRWGLASVFVYALTGGPSGEKANRIADELWTKFPQMKAELSDVKVVCTMIKAESHLHTTAKKVSSLDDVKGLKIIASGQKSGFMVASGASPIDMAPPEWYMSLERGLAQGLLSAYAVMTNAACEPLLKNHLELAVAPYQNFVIMNTSRWNSLPPEVQKEFDGSMSWMRARWFELAYQDEDKARTKCQNLGHSLIVLTPEQTSAWMSSTTQTWVEKWIKDQEGKGKPAKSIYDEAMRLAAQYRQQK
jgi:TRAP-type transport system periplasmic protein